MARAMTTWSQTNQAKEQEYRKGMVLSPGIVYLSGGKRVTWGFINGHSSGGGCFVNINGRAILSGNILNAEQAHAVAQDALMATVEGDWFIRSPHISWTPFVSDGIDLKSTCMVWGQPTQYAIVLDRKGLYILYDTKSDINMAWGSRHDCLKRLEEERVTGL